MEAAMREGQHVGEWNVSVAVAAKAAKLDKKKLLARAKSPEIEKRVRKATAELVNILDALQKKSASGTQPSVFSEITDDDIDNLFND